jgi:RimJ/RimL family protein N-acetyltransferase
VALTDLTTSLHGRYVELLPLERSYVKALAAASAIDRTTYGYTEVPDGEAVTAAYVDKMLRLAAENVTLPFVQRETATGRILGCTRYHEARYWRGRVEPDEIEIGGTWLAADAQRTPINTEAKFLLLRHAFETWKVVRVCLATDERNARSRAAIERLGARFEGILRQHRNSTHPGEEGRPRNTAMFSIVDSEWPDVKAALEARLSVA